MGKVWCWNPHCSVSASFCLESGLRKKPLKASQGGRMCVEHDVRLGPEETGKSCHCHQCGQVLCSPPGDPETALGGSGPEQWRLRCRLFIARQTLGLGGLPLLPFPASTGLKSNGLDLLPSRLCQQSGRQTVSCVKVACDLGFPCKPRGQQYGSHCV